MGSMHRGSPVAWWLMLVIVMVGPVHKVHAQTNSTSDGSDNQLLCMAEMVSSIENSCSASDTQGYYVALEALLKQYLSKCFQTNFTENKALHEMMPDMNDYMTTWLQTAADAFKQVYNLQDVVPTFVPPTQVDAEVEFMLQHNLAISYDGWLLDPYVFGSISKYDGFYPLDSAIANPALGMAWDDVLPFVRNVHASFKGQVVAFPMDVSIQLLFSRRDLLNPSGITGSAAASGSGINSSAGLTGPMPNSISAGNAGTDTYGLTWQQLLDMVKKANGTIPPGATQPIYGICMDVRQECGLQLADVMSIAAPMLQYTGTNQGLFFDPPTFKSGGASALLVNNPAFQQALSLYVQLAQYAPPASPTAHCDDPDTIADMFRDGRCAFMMGTHVFKLLNATADGNSSVVRGNIGVSPLPGSSMVLDRASNQLVACNPDLCPYSVQSKDGTSVNLASWNPGGGWVLSVNKQSPTNSQATSAAFHASLTNPNTSWQYVTDPQFVFEPTRWQHLNQLDRWVARGYDQGDAQRWLSALAMSMDMNTSSPLRGGAPGLGLNMALDLRVPGTTQLRDMYATAITNVTLGAKVSDATAMLSANIMRLLQDPQKVQASWSEVADAYFATIQYQEPPTFIAPPGSSSTTPSWLPVAIILPVVAVLLLVALGVVYEVRNKRHHKDLWGKVVPPGAGPDTAILVMGVQDLAEACNVLSVEQLSSCMHMVSEVLNKSLQKHSGYLAGNSAGNYVAAFHSPKDALLAALEVQQQLLVLNWPSQLSNLSGSATMHVMAFTPDVQQADLSEILDVNEQQGGMALGQHAPRAGRQNRLKRFMKRKAAHAGNSDSMNGQDDDEDFGEEGDEEGADFQMSGMGAAPAGPIIPALMHVPTSETFTFAAACKRAWKDAGNEQNAGRVLIFRGLRMRMGVHVGLTNPEWIQPAKEDPSRMQYVGPVVELATAISDLAQGGMVLISEDTYKKLPLERLWDKHLVLHVGEHPSLNAANNPTNLYLAVNRTLEGRLAYLGPLMDRLAVEPGVLNAPVGYVTISFMNVVGAQTLLSWNADVAQSALKLFHTLVGEELRNQGGYLVEAVDGLFLAAFTKPSSAILWALECNDLMLRQNWPEELLSHELCEELVISSPTGEDEVMHNVVFRGLRLKAGVDIGQVLGEVHAMTGRMTYRGKVMNRAARVAGTASTGQVLCSNDAWDLAMSRDADKIQAARVMATSMGLCRLKGVADRMEIQHCRRMPDPDAKRTQGGRRASLVLSIGQKWNWAGNEHEQGGPGMPNDMVNGPNDVELEMLMAEAHAQDPANH